MCSWLESIDLSTFSAIASTFAAIAAAGVAFLTWRVATSSRDIAKNALKFQYMDSIKDSIDIVESALIHSKSVSIQSTDVVGINRTNYSVSTKRADWIFAAQEVKRIISNIKELSISKDDQAQLMERYGRILEGKLSVGVSKSNQTIFTSGSPNDSYAQSKLASANLSIRDEDLFVVYLFTEEYDEYVKAAGQYPVKNICCYFSKNGLKL